MFDVKDGIQISKSVVINKDKDVFARKVTASSGVEINTGSWDKDGLRLTGAAPSVYFSQNDGSNAYLGLNGDKFYVLPDTGSNGTFSSPYVLEAGLSGTGFKYYGNRVYHEGYKPGWAEVTGKPDVSINGHTHTSLLVQDQRTLTGADGDSYFFPSPEDLPDRSLSVYFGNISETSGNWKSSLTVKGWSGLYSAWQLVGGASLSAEDTLYLRTGQGDSWGSPKAIYHEGHKPSFTEVVGTIAVSQLPAKIADFSDGVLNNSYTFNSSVSLNDVAGLVFKHLSGGSALLNVHSDDYLRYRFGGTANMKGLSISNYDSPVVKLDRAAPSWFRYGIKSDDNIEVAAGVNENGGLWITEDGEQHGFGVVYHGADDNTTRFYTRQSDVNKEFMRVGRGSDTVRFDGRVDAKELSVNGSFFYEDISGRIRTNSEFYVNTSDNIYLYGSNVYLGSTSGDHIQVRSNLLSGTGWSIKSGGTLEISGELKYDGRTILNGSDTWLRTYDDTGWYNSTYGGGVYMNDSTYVKVYGGKKFRVLDSSQNSILTAGGVTAASSVGFKAGYVSLQDTNGYEINASRSSEWARGMVVTDGGSTKYGGAGFLGGENYVTRFAIGFNVSNWWDVYQFAVTDQSVSVNVPITISERVTLDTVSNEQLAVTNSYGYVRIGPANTGYAHFYTDRPQYYFDKAIQVDGQIRVYGSSNYLNTNGFYGNGSGLSGVNATKLDGLNSTSFLRSDADSSTTGSLSINNINKSVKIGDISANNYTEIKHADGNTYGFNIQYGNASVIVNQQGSANQVIVLGDVDSASTTTLFGIGYSNDSGSTWNKKLNYTGTGELYIGSSGNSKVWHDDNRISYTPKTAFDLNTENLNSLNTDDSAGFYFQQANARTPGKNYPAESAGSLLVQKSAKSSTSNTGCTQLYITYNNSGLYFRGLYGNTPAWRKVWHDGNDGSGSGLNADMLDGLHASNFLRSNAKAVDSDKLDGLNSSQFLRSDNNDTFNNTLTIAGRIQVFDDGSVPNGSTKFGRNTGQYMTFMGNASGNHMVSVSEAGNPKTVMKFAISTDDGASLDSTYDLMGPSGKIWTSGNDGSGSGLDADLVRGYGVNDAEAASTVVLRNTVADINARLFRSSYATQGSLSADSDICFRVNNTNDNYMRFVNRSGFFNWLRGAGMARNDADEKFTGRVMFGGDGNHNGQNANIAIGIGDADTGFKWNGDGDFSAMANSTQVTRFTRDLVSVNANLTIDDGANTTVQVLCDDAGEAEIKLMGSNQGTGRVYVGQSDSYGGGIEYNGDGTPAGSGPGSDYTTLFRKNNNSLIWTARNNVNSNDWEFRANITAYSDERLKTNFSVIRGALEKVCVLTGYTFNRTDIDYDCRQAGFKAQDVQKVLPEVVNIGKDKMRTLSLDYGKMGALYVEAIKELKTENDRLKSTLDDVLARLAALEGK